MTTIAYSGVPRVNLMPRSEIARRERDKLVRTWVWVVLASVVVALLIIAGAVWLKLIADQRLAAEQARTSTLLTEIASLSEVSRALNTEAELTDFRTQAMATDFAWAPIVAKLDNVLPGDAVLIGFDIAAGGAPQGTDPMLEVGAIGTFSVESPTPLDIVAIIRTLRGVEGVMYADGQSITSSQTDGSSFAYLVNVEFDQSVYSGDFTPVQDEEGE